MLRSIVRKSGLACAAITLAASLAAPASSTVTWYTSRSAFLAAAPLSADPTGMSAVTTDAQAVALMETPPSAWHPTAADDQRDITLGLVTISSAQYPIASHGFAINLSAGTPGSSVGFTGASYRIGNPENENHSYTIAGTGAQAFGFSVYEPRDGNCGTDCVISRFVFEAFDAANISLGTHTLDFGAPAGFEFVGVTTSTPLARMTVTESRLGGGSVYGCCLYDNEYFGNYLMTLGDGTSPVPEPVSWAMMLGGFGLVGGALRHRRRIALLS